MRAPTGRDRGLVLPLPVSVVLPPWSLAAYRTDPEALWAGIGSTVEVQVVPGVDRMMPREPV